MYTNAAMPRAPIISLSCACPSRQVARPNAVKSRGLKHPVHGVEARVACMRAQIVELLNIVYCLAELAEFAAFLHLRVAAPALRRPFRVPLPTW